MVSDTGVPAGIGRARMEFDSECAMRDGGENIGGGCAIDSRSVLGARDARATTGFSGRSFRTGGGGGAGGKRLAGGNDSDRLTYGIPISRPEVASDGGGGGMGENELRSAAFLRSHNAKFSCVI